MRSIRGRRRPPVARTLRRVAPLLGAFLLCADSGPANAQPSPHLVFWLRAHAAPPSVLAAAPAAKGIRDVPPGTVIGEVRIVTQDIFDPEKEGEDRLAFRFANRLHRATRPSVVQRQLLFRPGEVFSPDLVEESARLLRANDYLYDVDIQPLMRHDGRVDVEVTTRDVWTLEGGASFSRSGGANNTSLWTADTNLLGSGKELSVSRIGSIDRTSNLVRFRDPNVLGSRVRLTASYADNSDGGRSRFELEHPFYSLSTRWAAGLRAFRDDRLENLYKAGKVATGFEHRHDVLEVYGGLSPGLVRGSTRRWQLGYTFSRDAFEATARFPKKLFPLPPDRTFAYPWIGFDSIQDRFIVERDLNRFQRAEDLNLGRQFHLQLGWSSPSFGGGQAERWIVQTAAAAGWRPSPGQLVLAHLGGSTRWGSGDAENLVAGGRLRWYCRDFGEQLLYASLGADLAHRLDDESQLLLGGDSGLRGYPLRYQSGDRRVLLTLEQRFFSNRELFHLLHLGGAVFFDAGQAWFVDSLSKRDQKLHQQRQILKDLGLGLRLGSSRSSRGAVLHLDVAVPLDADRSIERLQWLVSTSDTF